MMSVSSDFQKEEQPSLTNFEVFGNQMKHFLECLIKLLKPLIILGEIQN